MKFVAVFKSFYSEEYNWRLVETLWRIKQNAKLVEQCGHNTAEYGCDPHYGLHEFCILAQVP
jgi:hypothetical protein